MQNEPCNTFKSLKRKFVKKETFIIKTYVLNPSHWCEKVPYKFDIHFSLYNRVMRESVK